MIDRAQFDLAVELLKAGGSRRAVARQAGVARSTVDAIAAGRHPRFFPPPPEPPPVPMPPPARCPGCGAVVYGECLACAVPRHLSPFHAVAEPEGIELELHGTALARYERVRLEKKSGRVAGD